MAHVESGDSAGQPWTGRHFGDNAHADDDGRASTHLADVLAHFASHDAGVGAVVDALRTSRLMIPLIARRGGPASERCEIEIDKSHELSIITVAGPDGRAVFPVFTSVETMRRWNESARPIPAGAQRVALAAVSEGIELIVIDPASDSEFVLRRPAVWALARSEPWISPWDDLRVAHEFESAVDSERGVLGVDVASGDPDSRLRGPELIVNVSLVPGLRRPELDALIARLGDHWSRNPVISDRVDSLRVKVLAAGEESTPSSRSWRR